jgi:hypothetical protein
MVIDRPTCADKAAGMAITASIKKLNNRKWIVRI